MKNEIIDLETIEYCPVGSVVILKNSSMKVMIMGMVFLDVSTKGKIYDYMGCRFPEGVLSKEEILYFYHQDIATILHLGKLDKKMQDAFFKYKKVHLK